MSDCPTCGHPMVWSQLRERPQCAVYGSHLDTPAVRAATSAQLRWNRHRQVWECIELGEAA